MGTGDDSGGHPGGLSAPCWTVVTAYSDSTRLRTIPRSKPPLTTSRSEIETIVDRLYDTVGAAIEATDVASDGPH
ncbi:hypothetical protein [Halostagnicola kamekurae]|uniref:Uncharacterized protein n=1 Tax=Halostagnicola kamekurae TaxID=619731 RepID=A0A1I6P048_9EURY|nr:hypothetical protein [Halostagnicola kamekurae]SFS33581.1 hypothetical protein SAMN04488556_0238 [Halostagnicola kamekurae]